MKKQLIFRVDRKDILNANKVLHYIVEGKVAARLRAMSSEAGVMEHPERELADKRLDEIIETAKKTLEKSRATKVVTKKYKDIEIARKAAEKETGVIIPKKTPKEIKALMEADIEELHNEIEKKYNIPTTKVSFMFEKFKIRMTVCPPTKRKTDPPNFYPTLKPLIDGLTDASWWQDDEFTQLLEVSFRYGGTSGTKDVFLFILDIEEIEDYSEYVLESETIERG